MTFFASLPFMNYINISTFRRVRTVAVNQSPFNGAAYRSGMQDDRWQFSFDYHPMTKAEARPLLVAIRAQREGTGALNVFDPDWGVPSTAANLTGYIGDPSGVPQTGTSVRCTGYPPLTLLASAGDRVGFQTVVPGIVMYELTADATSDGAGNVFFQIDIPLRAPPINFSGVVLNWAAAGLGAVFRMTEHSAQSQPGGLFNIRVSGEEQI